ENKDVRDRDRSNCWKSLSCKGSFIIMGHVSLYSLGALVIVKGKIETKTTQQMQFMSSMSEMVCVVILIKDLDLRTANDLHKVIEIIRNIAEKYQ
ncbi:hypothetical protein NPIL_521591, partial [Nephila pilipes]